MKKKIVVGKRVRIIIRNSPIPEDEPDTIIGKYTGFAPKADIAPKL